MALPVNGLGVPLGSKTISKISENDGRVLELSCALAMESAYVVGNWATDYETALAGVLTAQEAQIERLETALRALRSQ